jgi:hypothetical protein
MKKLICGVVSIILVLSFAVPALAVSAGDFTDVSSSQWYYTAVDYCVSRSMVQGTSATTFSPGDTMTRGQLKTAK